MSKTKKLTEGGRLITRAELQFFARAVDARIAQEVGKLREELAKGGLHVDPSVDLSKYMLKDIPEQPPTDSEGAE